MNFQESTANLEELIEFFLPKDSDVTNVNLSSRFGSLFADVHFTVTEEYRVANNLEYANRVMQIRLIKGEDDKGLPIGGFADRA